MYHPDPTPESNHSNHLQLLEAASDAPSEACLEDPETREAFDDGLRQLAQDIIQFHPDIAHILLGMGETASGTVHGQN